MIFKMWIFKKYLIKIKDNVMRLINRKSIIECDEYEEKSHNDEIFKIESLLNKLPNYDCAVIFKNINSHKKIKI